MKIKASELIGPALDWAVAYAQGVNVKYFEDRGVVSWDKERGRQVSYYAASTTWSIAGPIMEDELICVDPGDGSYSPLRKWAAWYADNVPTLASQEICGLTPLIAICRCYVQHHLGNEVDVPDEFPNTEDR